LSIYTTEKNATNSLDNRTGIRSVTWKIKFKRNSYAKHFQVVDVFQLRKILASRPDLIIVNECTMLTFWVVFINRLYRCKVLLLIENSHLNHFRKTLSFASFYIRKFVFSAADLIMTNNKMGLDFILSFGVNSGKIICKPYLTSQVTCDMNDLDRKSDSNMIQLLYVGQLIERKGIRILLRSLAKLDPEWLERLQLMIVGEGDQADLLRDYVEDHRIAGVNFLGTIAYSELGKVYQAADVMVIPTLHDYRSLVGFEALSCGLPILHSIYDGAVSEVTEPGLNGYRYDPQDQEDFRNKVGKLLGSDCLTKFRKRSYEKAYDFSYSQIIANLRDGVAHALQ